MLYDIATVFWRDWVVLKRRFGRYILSRMVAPVMYLVCFGWGIGRNVQTGHGSYLDFIVPGIIALNSMTISFNAVATPVNMSRIYHKTLEEYLIAPISAASFVLGKVLSGILRGFISSLVIIVLAYAFGASFAINGWFLLILLVNSGTFAALAVVAAMTFDSHEDLANANTYILMPMSFLCGTFFATANLPAALRLVIDVLPLTHAATSLRALAAGHAVSFVSLAVLGLYMAVLIAIGILQVRRLRQ